jgi:hypothetical protein
MVLSSCCGERASEIQTAIDELRDRETSSRDKLTVLEGDLATLTEERDSVNVAALLAGPPRSSG